MSQGGQASAATTFKSSKVPCPALQKHQRAFELSANPIFAASRSSGSRSRLFSESSKTLFKFSRSRTNVGVRVIGLPGSNNALQSDVAVAASRLHRRR